MSSILSTVVAIGCLALALTLMPSGAAWWQKILVGIFSVAFGFRIGTMLGAPAIKGLDRFTMFLLSLTFLFMIFGVLALPAMAGGVLILVGFTWRYVVAIVMRS